MNARELVTAATTTTTLAAALLLSPTTAAAQEAAPDVAVSVKPGKGITFEQEGDFKLNLKGRFQALETIAEEDDDVRTEALIRRARLNLDGYVFDENIAYKFELAFAPRDLDETGSPVLDAYLDLGYLRDLKLRVGQYKVPFDRQRVISSANLQLVDRSPLLAEVTLDRDIGLTLHSEDLFGRDGMFSYALGMYNGEGRGRVEAPSGFLYVARGEFRPFGAFDDYTEGDLGHNPTPKLALGASAGWNENSIRSNSNRGSAFREELATFEGFEGFDYLHLEADAMFKWSGFSLLSEFIWRDARGDENEFTGTVEGETTTILPRNAWGWFVQGGQMIGDNWEIAGRYTEQFALDGSSESLNESLATAGRELVGGVNWYVEGHPLKVQADYSRLWGTEVDGVETVEFADGANVVRVQLQATF